VGAQRISSPITVAQFEQIPNPPGGRYELHHGELVFVTFPVHEHKVLQRRLRKLLESVAESRGYAVDTEFPYRPLPDHEVWGADVAALNGERYNSISKWLDGSPELVIEVKSPSNDKKDMYDKAMTTLAGQGAIEFWIVDPETCTVTVHSKKSGMTLYRGDMQIPTTVLDGGYLCSPSDLFC
jgi:Uma2 family endonuclease